MANNLRFGILTVSDTCYGDPSKDKSGPQLAQNVLETYHGSTIIFKEIVPDHLQLIECTLRDKSTVNSNCDVILVTGGTGFAPRDVTPEATRAVIQKEAPGLAYAMISKSLEITEMAMLSRMVCGIRNNTIIVNLPGSAKGSVECFGFIKKALPHAVALARDHEKEVKATHETVHGGLSYAGNTEKSKVKLLVALRNRKSPYPMLEVDEATKLILEETSKLTSNIAGNVVDISQSINRILAEDIVAKDPLPPFPASIKDGYAVLASDGVGVRKVRDVIAAGDFLKPSPLQSGEVIRISTGAPVPEGADCVVQVEDTELVKASGDGTKELEIKINVAPKTGQDIRPVGSDIPLGKTVMSKGERISVGHIGVLATVGVTKVKVVKRPRIGVLSTGNELQNPHEELKPFHIRDSNKSTLLALLKQFNFEASDCGIARDTPDEVKKKLWNALKSNDVVITTGGVSMGEFDVIKKVLEVDFCATVHFGRVNMKPGKPTTFATCMFQNQPKLIFGLPGNPVSAIVTSVLFVLPALRKLTQDIKLQLPIVKAHLIDWKGPSSLDIRPEYVRVSLQPVESGGKESNGVFFASPTGNQISSRLNSFIGANGLLRLPGRNEQAASFITNETVFDVLLLDPFAGSF